MLLWWKKKIVENQSQAIPITSYLSFKEDV